jgi:hypothetical protein
MAEPKHNADELLKRYAAERRAQAPKEFHPAARRILRGEVARVYGSAARGALPWWKKLTAPRFAWSLGLVGILALSIVSLKRPPAEKELPAQAKKQDAEKDMSVGLEVALETETAPAKTENGPSASERLLADSASLDEPTGNARGFSGGIGGTRPAPAATVPPPVTAAGEAPVALGREVRKVQANEARAEAKSLERNVAAAAAPVPLQAQQTLFFSNFAAPGPTATTKAVAAQATVQTQILNRFSLDQRGAELQVRDEDGSIYKGLLTAQQQTQAAYAFRVTGTNNTLRQPVVFTGQVMQTQVPALAQQQRQRPAADQYQRSDRAAQNNFYDNNQVRLQGQATVGQSRTVVVDAQNTIAPAVPAPAQK